MSIEKLASRLLNSIIHHQENLFVWSILLTQKNCTTSTIVLPVWIQLYYNVQCSYRKLLTHCLRWWAKKSNILITTRYALHNIIYLMLLCDSIWLNVTQQRNLILYLLLISSASLWTIIVHIINIFWTCVQCSFFFLNKILFQSNKCFYNPTTWLGKPFVTCLVWPFSNWILNV